jgi:hypothetical protein
MSTHKNAGDKYFDLLVPEPSAANPRLLGRIYNFFQYLGPNKTRHIAFWNTDPQLTMVPTSFGNYMMGTIYYENMNRLQKLSADLNDASNENY